MSLFSNIKFQYQSKILQEFISSSNYHDFFNVLNRQKHNKKLYLRLLIKFLTDVIKNTNNDILASKAVWINSFLKEDTVYISNFLNSYVNKDEQNANINSYEELIINVLKEFEEPKNLSFNDLINFSYLYQYLILDNFDGSLKIINNQLPFFSTQNNLNFTNSTLSRCFIYVVDHPYRVYQKLKVHNDNNQNQTRSDFLNIDNANTKTLINGVNVEINKMGWQTHFNSWCDHNVINTLNGIIIMKKDLIQNTYDILSSIVMHLIQSGADVKMDYDFIESYVNNYPVVDFTIDNSLSIKEKKFINNYVGDILANYNFWNYNLTLNLKALNEIDDELKFCPQSNLLIVTKNQTQETVKKLLDKGYFRFGENKVQEAKKKFNIESFKVNFELHLIGPLQTNKVKSSLRLFDTIQTIDRTKLVDEIVKHIKKQSDIVKTKDYFIQVNIGRENQKSGVRPENLKELYNYCFKQKLNICGLMCIPPVNKNPNKYYIEMLSIRDQLDKNLKLSMGMSDDYKIALAHGSNLIRVGSKIFE